MSPYHTLVITLHLRAFFIIHANVWTMIKEYETASHKNSLLSSVQKSAPALEDEAESCVLSQFPGEELEQEW